MSFLGFPLTGSGDFTDGDLFGPGSIFIPGASSNPNAQPVGVGSGNGSIISISDGSGNQVPTSGGGGSDVGSLLSSIFPFAQLGLNGFLSNQALTSSRPSTVTVLPNGQTIVTGGGAASPLTSSLSSISPVVWIAIAVLILIMVIHK